MIALGTVLAVPLGLLGLLAFSPLPGAAGGAVGEPVTCAGEPATVVGTEDDDVLRGTPEADVIAGLGGDDRVVGLAGDDLICGGAGSDVVRAGAGADTVHDLVTGRRSQRLDGGPGRDTLVFSWQVREDGEVVFVDFLTDLRAGRAVVGDTGRSFPLTSFRELRALFAEGVWSAVGGPAAERFTAHQYVAVTVRAGGGRDRIDGSWHDDVIVGGPGRDAAYASRGRDVCRSVERGPLDECELGS